MARKKDPAKPLLAVKFEFVDSLDAMCQEAINLISAVKFAIDHGDLKPAVKQSLQERLDAFHNTMFRQDGEA